METGNKFSKFTKKPIKKDKEEKKITNHADLQEEVETHSNRATTLTFSLTFAQRKELDEYAKNDDRSMGYIIKKVLIEKGIISEKEK